MINKLRHKFVLVATVSVATMLLVVVLGATLFNYVDLNEKADNMVQLVVDNNGVLAKSADKQKPHDDLPREAMFNTRFFVVYLDSEKNITSTDTGNIFAADSEMAQNYATEVIEKDSDSGFLNDYKYKETTVNNQNAIVFVDVSSDINMVKKFLVNGSLIALLSIILVAVISYVLSPIAIKPTIEAYEKQKKFITDASHEIKTPLTVISANLDIIEMDSGENKWTKSAKTQVTRLTELVNRLVSLSRMDEATSLDKEKFSLSELCEMVAESYDSIALSSNKEFRTELEENIYYTGSEKSFNQL
ncbi:MAG: HAMP domain-containing histidine kinase, partial [Clostridiales bacterium]|nr:HAMP domain-containing histidine kinase [Clostridiales bacterium]